MAPIRAFVAQRTEPLAEASWAWSGLGLVEKRGSSVGEGKGTPAIRRSRPAATRCRPPGCSTGDSYATICATASRALFAM